LSFCFNARGKRIGGERREGKRCGSLNRAAEEKEKDYLARGGNRDGKNDSKAVYWSLKEANRRGGSSTKKDTHL